MKQGIIVYTEQDAKKNEWFINRIIELGMEYGLFIKLVMSEKATECECDFAIMRDRSYGNSKRLEDKGVRIFNSALVTKVCNDKWETYNYFKDKNVPMMYTQKFSLPYPFVMKPRDGHGGQSVYLIENQDQSNAALEEIKNAYFDSSVQNDNLIKAVNEHFIFQFKATETGKDLRVYVLGDMILTSMLRESETDFRANFSVGGHAKEVALSDDEMKIVSKVTQEMQSDFIGIDIIYNNGAPVLNEIEDVVGTRMLYKYTDIDACKEYVKYISDCLNSND
ncbi:MAG: ATP-grasp domain-containing protein [Lachnospiraceae bacterium]|nr:ATP-grasp domain-containing protein [Lachnospiraceae bacterium]